MNKKPDNVIVRLFRGLWRTLDFSRRLAMNLVFLLIIAIVIVAIFRGGPAKLEDQTILVWAPRGDIVEQYSNDPTAAAINQLTGQELPETQLRDLVSALERAAKDDAIHGVLIQPDQMGSVGYATLEELRDALRAFKTSGKPLWAYSEGMGQAQYYLASMADKIYMHPDAGVLMLGIGRFRNYYKDTLEAMKVDVHLYRVGTFKSFAEPYIRTDMSEEDRSTSLHWMDDVWTRFLTDIAEQRKLDPAVLRDQINRFDEMLIAEQGDTGQLTVTMGLVDELKTRDEVREMLKAEGAEDSKNNTFRQIALGDYVKRGNAEQKLKAMTQDQVAVVVAQGEITGGNQPPSSIGGESTSMLIRKAREDKKVKAIVLRVDSPGGGVFPSEQIRREVELTKAAGKPLVVSMGDVAASGGYWISMNADRIYARPTTITGSIGIFGLMFKLPRTAEEFGKIYNDGVGTTPWAGLLSPFQPMPEAASRALQVSIERGYSDFIGKVASARGQTPEQIDQVAQGRVWSGAQAHQHGLIDDVGGIKDAIHAAAELAKLEADAYAVVYRQPELKGFRKFLADMSDARREAMGWQAAAGMLDPRAVAVAESLRRDLSFLASHPGRPAAVYAHCLCEPN